jgi:hypothetical protein
MEKFRGIAARDLTDHPADWAKELSEIVPQLGARTGEISGPGFVVS